MQLCRPKRRCTLARLGAIDLRAQTQIPSVLRSDIHEGASVKAGARRDRDFPNIHSASPAKAGRHETFCGRPHSHRRRRAAPCRSSGYNLGPALDLDLAPADPRPGILCVHLTNGCRFAGSPPGRLRHRVPRRSEASGGPGGEGPGPAAPSPQDGGPQAPPGPPDAGTRRHRVPVGARR